MSRKMRRTEDFTAVETAIARAGREGSEATRNTPPAMLTFHPRAARNIWRRGICRSLASQC